MRSLFKGHPLFCLLACTLLSACGGGESSTPPPSAETAPPAATEEAAQAAPAVDEGPLVIFLGDSLTAGYGLDTEQAFPALLEATFEAKGQPLRVVNAGVSGDTTAGGLRRLDWLLRQEPDILMVALGGNDGLRGLDLEASEENLRQIVVQAQEAGAKIILAGMLMPPNYGVDYTEGFAAIYPRLTEEHGLTLVPFLLEGVAARPELNLPDGIHPTAEGQEILAGTVEPYLAAVLDSLSGE